ncbi:uncharacterized protein BDFB_013967 [Asbolus verrucosus]|uniref:VWFC domain-containing protein n=1 Tax=Asbolus verrucosus TaxID=1661398 RepID=A0A482W2T8_ASBVE|nr:uncharacterized protein BDFB_013967 [Asbolus verrucosus]
MFTGASCDNLGILLYEDLGCTPQYEESKLCPVKYSCQGLEESDKYCYFRGKAYANQEIVDESLSDPSCDRGCFCDSYGGRSSFVCAVLDCPAWLGVPTTLGCYRKYSLNECCSTGEVCPPFDNVEKCVVDGTEYKEGEHFFPNNTCLICICQKGFNGKLEEPFCRRWNCGVQLKRSGENLKKFCAPWYDNSRDVLCCPYKWICLTEETCKFGEKSLKVGQKFEKFSVDDGFGKIVDKVECECIIPPLVTCRDAA